MKIKHCFYLILFLLAQNLDSQKLIADTIWTSPYGCYYEAWEVRKYYLPEDAKEYGLDPAYELHDEIPYLSERLSMVYHKKVFYTPEDFKVCIGQKCFKYNYPSFKYGIYKSDLHQYFRSIRLVDIKNRDTTIIDDYKIEFLTKKGDTLLQFVPNMLLSEADSINTFNSVKQIYISLSDKVYPYEEQGGYDDGCGYNRIRFPKQKLIVIGN